MQDVDAQERARVNRYIAETILGQLGGKRLSLQTGADRFAVVDSGLSFNLPDNFAKDGINRVCIRLNGSDYYDIDFHRQTGLEKSLIARREDVSVSELHETMRDVTALETRPIRFAMTNARDLAP